MQVVKTENYRSIAAAFALIIMLLVGLGAFSLTYLIKTDDDARKLYHHPYSVSNAAREISINQVTMHRHMKDVVLAGNDAELQKAISLVDKHEQLVLKDFELIFERYLGNRSDIESAFNAFINWKAIRDEVVFLKNSGRDGEAAEITKYRGAEHVAFMKAETQRLIDFADNKAKEFLNKAVEAKHNALMVISALLVVAVVCSVALSVYTIRSLRRSRRAILSRMNLVDQNIMMARLDEAGVIVDASSSLCRLLGTTKERLVGTQSNFFINNDFDQVSVVDIINVVSTGMHWEGEIQRLDKNQERQWLYSVVHPEQDNEYKITGYSNIVYDITARKYIEELSVTDNLTQLHNRRYFDKVIEKEILLARRHGLRLTLAVIDVDFFKRFNDCKGHPAGDVVLANVARVFQQTLCRSNDYCFRLGGEEFALLFSSVDERESYAMLERVRCSVEKIGIYHPQSDVSKFVTVSIGACCREGRDVPDAGPFYKRADEALYSAKQRRNAVCISLEDHEGAGSLEGSDDPFRLSMVKQS